MMPTAPSEPSERTPAAAAACMSSGYVPTVDALNAAIGGINVFIASTARTDEIRWYGVPMDRETALIVGVTQLALFTPAAIYGFAQIARCKALQREFEEEPLWEPKRPNSNRPAARVRKPRRTDRSEETEAQSEPREAEGMVDFTGKPPRTRSGR